ncbi:tetratricopeptide repeat protein [Bradyrhizobium sp. UFLA05-109]
MPTNTRLARAWEGGIRNRLEILAVCLVMVGGIFVSRHAASPDAAMAEAAQRPSKPNDTSSTMQTVTKLLTEPGSPSRDDQLYAAALALFKAIEAGEAPVENRDMLARALHAVAIGGHADAWIDYGRCLWNGWGVPESKEEAIAAYKHGADLGSDYGAYIVAYNLYWTFKRYDEAYDYAIRALKGTDPDGALRYLLGLMAYNGRGRPKDVAESLALHLEAAKRGNADAYFELSVYAMQGIGDRSKAVFYLKQAGQRDQPRACANLGALYATGQLAGIEKDLTESVHWYKRAADLGVGRAAAALGVMATRGEGMAKDPDAAEAYFDRAEKLGFELDEYLNANGVKRKK